MSFDSTDFGEILDSFPIEDNFWQGLGTCSNSSEYSSGVNFLNSGENWANGSQNVFPDYSFHYPVNSGVGRSFQNHCSNDNFNYSYHSQPYQQWNGYYSQPNNYNAYYSVPSVDDYQFYPSPCAFCSV